MGQRAHCGQCDSVQVIIGSYPHGDGTFDKANDFQSVVVDGAWSMGLGTLKLHSGQVAYVVPAAKGAHAPVNKPAPLASLQLCKSVTSNQYAA